MHTPYPRVHRLHVHMYTHTTHMHTHTTPHTWTHTCTHHMHVCRHIPHVHMYTHTTPYTPCMYAHTHVHQILPHMGTHTTHHTHTTPSAHMPMHPAYKEKRLHTSLQHMQKSQVTFLKMSITRRTQAVGQKVPRSPEAKTGAGSPAAGLPGPQALQACSGPPLAPAAQAALFT